LGQVAGWGSAGHRGPGGSARSGATGASRPGPRTTVQTGWRAWWGI